MAFFPQVDESRRQIVDAHKWELQLAVRERALKEIEAARNRKEIGDALEAQVEMHLTGDTWVTLQTAHATLQELLVVSQLEIVADDSESISIKPAGGNKCPRCWNRFTAPTSEPHPELCPRCRRVVQEDHLEPAR